MLYRLRFLLRTISRANGNWGVNLRYRGKVLEAIKLLETNAEIAQEVGMRELVRVGSNIAQYNAIRGIESDFLQAYFEGLLGSLKLSDSQLERRLALTRTVFIGKQLGAESDVYTKNAAVFLALRPKTTTDFWAAQNSVEQIDKEVEDIEQSENQTEEAENTEGDDNPLLYLKKRIPNKRLFLSVGKNKDITAFKVTHLLAEDTAYRELWIGKPNREIADMYYQYGKLVLSTKFFNEQTDYFEEARLTFENARYCANVATFKYLEMEALEALYRLCYLASTPKYRAMKDTYQADFKALRDEIAGKEADYGTYFDLLAKFELTEGDFRLDEILMLPFTKLTLWHSVFSHYALALNHAHRHNQERYLLILEAFAERIRTVFKKAKTAEAIENIENWLTGFFKAQAIFKEDSTFGLHLKTLLRAARLETLKQFDANKAIYAVHFDIRELAKKGKFIKAAQANNSLIRLFKSQSAYKSQLATRYFQQFYFYLGATQRGRVNKLLEQMAIDFNLTNTEGGQCQSFEEAVFYLVRGTADYRTDEFWNMEKFVYGELEYFKIKFGRKLIGQAKAKPTDAECIKAATAKFESAETKLIKSIKYLNTYQSNTPKTKIVGKLIAEGLFRLGELYILMELEKGEKDDLENYLDEHIVTQNMYNALTNKQEHSDSKIYKRSPSVHTLNCAYYFAKHIGDKHREIDALQSIANARYFLGQTIEKDDSTTEEKEVINNNIHHIIDKTHNKLRKETAQIDDANKNMFPIVVAKSYLVEGDIYFSRLFEIDQTLIDKTNRIHFKLRDFWKNDLEDWQTQEKIKAILHEMLWAYLKGLDLLTDSDKVYENYHFNNMAYEINRRVRLIQERDLVRMLFEDLKPIWDNFQRLEHKDKPETWDSLTYSMRVHELALAANTIFNQ